MEQTPQQLQQLLQSGCPQAVIDAIDSGTTSIAPFRVSLFLFDAHWALGNLDRALSHLDLGQQIQAEDARLADRFSIAYRHTGDERWRPTNLLPPVERSFSEPDTNRIAELFLRLRDLDGCDSFLHHAARSEPLSPRLTLRLARIKYLQDDFELSESLATPLLATEVAVAAQRLLRTISFRRGHFEQVLKTPSTALTDFDHLQFNALLAVGRISDAFAMMPFPRQLEDLAMVFPTTARKRLGRDGRTTAIVSESGPGDQLVDVVALHRIPHAAANSIMTVDPRLHSLLTRSYPHATFVPSDPLDRAVLGHLAAGHDRHTGELVDLLTTPAYDAALACDHVVLARSLKSALDEAEDVEPDADLVPRSDLVSEVASRGADKIGLCWRSEKQNAQRDIHYLEASELSALFAGGHQFLCLQHDVTEDERSQLEHMAPGRIDFVQGIDLRNDFEKTAALMANLRCVVGPGTTATVLAAALGRPTLVMHPTHFGTWLGQPHGDYWFASRENVVVGHPRGRQRLVDKIGQLLLERFPPTSARPT